MPILIILRGNSGAGKSTVAHKLRKRMGRETMLISQDVVRREILRVHDTADNPSIKLIEDMALYGKSIGYDVVLEGILHKDKYTPMLQRLIKEFGSKNTYVYIFDIPFEETLKRHALKSVRDDYGEKEMREWWAEKDYIGIPGETLLGVDMKEDEIVEVIYKELS